MKKPFFREFRGKQVVNQSYIGYLHKNNIRLLRSKDKIVLLFYTEKTYQSFINEFEIIPECICVIKKIALDEYFVHLHKKVASEVFLNYGLSGKKGFLGKGIYAVHEQELFVENSAYQRYVDGVKRGDPLSLSSSVVFSYSGPYIECVSGKDKKGIVNLLTNYVDGQNILAVLEEEILLLE